MKPLTRHPLAEAVRRYVRSRRESLDLFTAEDVRRAVVEAAPQWERWYLCEVDGACYAVRISRHGQIELMANIFHQQGLSLGEPQA